jgi:adenosylhomocysteine nucleosidase
MQVNNGIVNTGPGTVSANGAVFGTHAQHRPPPGRGHDRVDVGLLTVLGVETYAVGEMLYRGENHVRDDLANGVTLHRATIAGVRVAALQALSPGQRAASVAVDHLRRLASPRIVVLVGIAGSVAPTVRPGDVVLAHEVFYYESRKETADGTERRGQMLASAWAGRRLNAYMSTFRPPVIMADPGTPGLAFEVRHGPIGSGEAVIAHTDAAERRYLAEVNRKILAVETEAGAVAQAVFEDLGGDGAIAGWLTARGISDRADEDKSDDHHYLAARHAAQVTERLLPFLAERR